MYESIPEKFKRSQRGPITEDPSEVLVKNYIRSVKEVTEGKVIEAELGENLAMGREYIYLLFEQEPTASEYLVIENKGIVSPGANKGAVKGPFGYNYSVQGLVELREKVESKFKGCLLYTSPSPRDS